MSEKNSALLGDGGRPTLYSYLGAQGKKKERRSLSYLSLGLLPEEEGEGT